MNKPKLIINDGGRAAAGFKGKTGDCGCRALAIATGKPYQEVYDMLIGYAAKERTALDKTYRVIDANGVHTVTVKGRAQSHPRTGIRRDTFRKVVKDLGGVWRPMMTIGSGCTVHLRASELPAKGRHILSLSGHYAAWVDGELHDTYDCSRNGSRCVYGVFSFPG